jgi:hypothetical protein
MPALGEHFDVEIPASSLPAITVAVIDATSKGTFTATQLKNTVWSLRYQALFHYNRSPWVQRGYSAPIADVVLVAKAPAGAWPMELLDTSDQEGAIGYHEDKASISKAGPSGAHAARGKAAGGETPLSKVFCKTAKQDNVPITEVASHEMCEMAVDPWVVDEAQIRKYLDSSSKQWYLGEVGDPVQDRAYDVGAPESRPAGVPEALVSDFAYPSWWGQPQTRPFTSAAAEFKQAANLAPFALAPGGYMSVAPEAKPEEWTQIYGTNRAAAEKASDAYERPGKAG